MISNCIHLILRVIMKGLGEEVQNYFWLAIDNTFRFFSGLSLDFFLQYFCFVFTFNMILKQQYKRAIFFAILFFIIYLGKILRTLKC